MRAERLAVWLLDRFTVWLRECRCTGKRHGREYEPGSHVQKYYTRHAKFTGGSRLAHFKFTAISHPSKASNSGKPKCQQPSRGVQFSPRRWIWLRFPTADTDSDRNLVTDWTSPENGHRMPRFLTQGNEPMSNRSSATELATDTWLRPAKITVPVRNARPKLREVVPAARWTRPAAILFDLDGTLIDTMQVFADVAADVIVRHHQLDRAASRAAYLKTSGIPFFQQLEVIAPGDARNADAAAEFEARKVVAVADVTPSETTVAGLEAMRALGISIAVCSNNFQDQVDHFLSNCPVDLDLALGFGNGLAKGPTMFDAACREFDCRRDDLIFVGDSIADANLANASALRFVGRLGTFDATAFAAASPISPVVTEITEILSLFR